MKIDKKLFILLSTFFIASCGPSTQEPSTEISNPSSEITPSISEPSVIPTEPSTSLEEPTISIEPSIPEPSISIKEGYVVYESTCYTNVEDYVDPYTNVSKTEFYENYTISSSYIDSYYRSKHGLLSGEYIEDDGSNRHHENAPKFDEKTYYKNANARFGVNEKGERVSYTINTIDGTAHTIYRGGMYISMNDVCAYVFAFNDLPANYYSGVNLKSDAYNEFGEIARLNFNKYTGPSANKYQYEPYLKGQDDKTLFYRELDFGATCGDDHYYSYKNKYGSSNGRGPFRILISNSYDNSYTYSKSSKDYFTPNPTDLDDRYVYYTYNHYNDFVEYLNYYDGFGDMFGNVTAGNEENEYNSSNPPVQRTDSILAIF